MKAIRINVDGTPEELDVPNTVQGIQAAIGGYFEPIQLDGRNIALVDEDGLRKELPYNQAASRIVYGIRIVGPMLLLGVDGAEFTDYEGGMP